MRRQFECMFKRAEEKNGSDQLVERAKIIIGSDVSNTAFLNTLSESFLAANSG